MSQIRTQSEQMVGISKFKHNSFPTSPPNSTGMRMFGPTRAGVEHPGPGPAPVPPLSR